MFTDARITSGGGFSNVSDLPGWQKDYVNEYLKIATNLPYGQFKPTKRGFPDVAANAHNYLINIAGQGFMSVDGYVFLNKFHRSQFLLILLWYQQNFCGDSRVRSYHLAAQ